MTSKPQLSKVAYVVPSDKRLEFERFAEEWFASAGIEIKHLWSLPYDPDKPATIFKSVRGKAPVNGPGSVHQPATPHRRPDAAAIIFDLMSRERRPFANSEIVQRTGLSTGGASLAIKRLVDEGKIKRLTRTLVVFAN